MPRIAAEGFTRVICLKPELHDERSEVRIYSDGEEKQQLTPARPRRTIAMTMEEGNACEEWAMGDAAIGG